MKKSKRSYKLILTNLVAVILITALPAYSTPTIKETAYRFLYTMGGVALSSIVIFLGLTIYNKILYNANKIRPNEEQPSLRTPINVEEAVISFIKRNKLR